LHYEKAGIPEGPHGSQIYHWPTPPALQPGVGTLAQSPGRDSSIAGVPAATVALRRVFGFLFGDERVESACRRNPRPNMSAALPPRFLVSERMRIIYAASCYVERSKSPTIPGSYEHA
jgi:hypothetical protein